MSRSAVPRKTLPRPSFSRAPKKTPAEEIKSSYFSRYIDFTKIAEIAHKCYTIPTSLRKNKENSGPQQLFTSNKEKQQ